MNADRTRNVFQIFTQLGRVPFAVARSSWHGDYVAIVTKVLPKDNYGIACGFPVANGIPNAFFASELKWRTDMVMPNAGSYQWHLVEMSDQALENLIQKFYDTVAKQYGFISPEADKLIEKEYLKSLLNLE